MSYHHQHPVVIDYLLDGPRTAAAVASGRSRLLGISAAAPSQPAYHRSDALALLTTLADQPRIYYDATLAIVIELRYGLPFAPEFDDVRAMLSLLQQQAPGIVQRAEALRAGSQAPDTPAASLARASELQGLAPRLIHRIDTEGLSYVYREIELRVEIPTAVMTSAGVRFNRRTLNELRNAHGSRMESVRRELAQAAGSRFNPDDDRAACDFLYRESCLPCTTQTRRGNPSASKAALTRLEPLHPAVRPLLEYRDAKPVFNSASALIAALGSGSLVFSNIDPQGTITGRFSCSDPPLQSLDARVRQAVEAAPGCVLLEADYSQMELRVLAHFSQDPRLLEAFQRDQDLHRRTAATVLGLPEDAVNEQQRQLGKKLNFAIVYGQTAYGLSEELLIPVPEAQAHLAAYSAAYPRVAAWIAAVHEQVALAGEVRTLFGRRRYLVNIHSACPADVSEARRHAVNTIIQGTAADLMKLSLVRLHEVLPPEVRILMTVHDSVLLEVPENLVDATRTDTIAVMQAQPSGFSVPIKVEVGIGKTWAECKKHR